MTSQQPSDAEKRFIISETEIIDALYKDGMKYTYRDTHDIEIKLRNLYPYDPAALKAEERERIFAILKILCSCDEIGIGTRIYDSMRTRFPEGQP